MGIFNFFRSKTDISALETRLDSLQRLETGLKSLEKLEAVLERLQKLEAEIKGLQKLEADLKNLQSLQEGGLKSVQKNIERVELHLATLAKSLEERVDESHTPESLEVRIIQLGEEICEVKQRVSYLDPMGKEKEGHLSMLHNEVATIASTLAEVSGKIVTILIAMDNASKNTSLALQEGQRQILEQEKGLAEQIISLMERESEKIESMEKRQADAFQAQVQMLIQQIFQNMEAMQKEQSEFYRPAFQKLDGELAKIAAYIEEKVATEVNRMGKTLFRLNSTAESVRENFEKGMAIFDGEREQYQKEQQRLREKGKEDIRDREIQLGRDMFLLMDSLDAGIETGEEMVKATAVRPLFGILSRSSAALSEAIKSWLTGIKMMRKRVLDLLASLGIEPIESLHQTFNPALHCAIAVEEGPENIVVKEITKGYKTRDRVLRYAQVVVGKPQQNKGQIPLNTL